MQITSLILFQVFDFSLTKGEMDEIASIKTKRRYFDMMGAM